MTAEDARESETHRPPPVIPPERQLSAVAAAITKGMRPYRWRAFLVGCLAGILAGGVVAPIVTTTAFLTSLVAGAPWMAQGRWDDVVWGLAFALTLAVVAASALTWWLPGDLRAATEAYVWLIDRSEADWRARIGDEPIPRKSAQFRSFAETTAPTPENAVQLYAAWLAIGEFDRARAIAEYMPDATPADRFARAGALWLVEFLPGPTPPLEPLEMLAGAIIEPTARVEAEVELALSRSRAQLAAGGDWKASPAAARQLLADLPARPYRRIIWWPAFRGTLAYAALGAAVFWVASAPDFRVF